MKWGSVIIAAVVAAVLFAGGCIFRPQPFKGVISYRHEKVYIGLNPDRYYRVGELPAGWEPIKTRARAIVFYNDEHSSTIATDAWCGNTIGDRPLESLGGELLGALADRDVQEEVPFMLDGRGALRQRAIGELDGVPIVLDIVVIKKNGCVFDLYAIMPPDEVEAVERDFELFYLGFRYE